VPAFKLKTWLKDQSIASVFDVHTIRVKHKEREKDVKVLNIEEFKGKTEGKEGLNEADIEAI